MTKPLITHVVGARPNIMKLGPLWHALNATGKFRQTVIHTGQHWDGPLSGELFEDFELATPDHNLAVGNLTPVMQFAAVIQRMAPILEANPPALLMTYGDVRSTSAATICGHHMGVKVAHYEAGFRTRSRIWPEEFHRITADAYSDLLLVVDYSAEARLLNEGRSQSDLAVVGDLMCDAALIFSKLPMPAVVGKLAPRSYGVFTFHHGHSVDTPGPLGEVLDLVELASRKLPLVIPVHPRTRGKLEEFGLMARLTGMSNLTLLPPLRYREFVPLVKNAAFVATDSGGLAAESVCLGTPMLSLNPIHLHPLAGESGGVSVCHRDKRKFQQALSAAIAGKVTITVPWPYDGRAGRRCIDAISAYLETQ